jgi:hypothetical protein
MPFGSSTGPSTGLMREEQKEQKEPNIVCNDHKNKFCDFPKPFLKIKSKPWLITIGTIRKITNKTAPTQWRQSWMR